MIDELGRAGSRRERYPIRTVDVVAVIVFWSLLALISAVGRELDPRIPGLPNRITSAVIRATYAEYSLWAALTLPIWWLASRYSIEGTKRVGRVLLFVALGIAIALLVDALLLEIRKELMENQSARMRRRPPPTLVGLGILDDLMVYFAVFGSGVARDYFLRYQARLEETVRLQAQLAQARLDVLRSQLNPHFLFNTLNAISALVERDPRGTRRMIARLSDLLRYTLEASTETEVPLHRELDLLEEYIELMQIRFQGKLEVAISVDENAREGLVPNLIMQPIVENAIKHGVSQLGAGTIAVTARRVDRNLVLTVSDSGAGPAGGEEGIGLSNTNARLREMYGPEHKVTLRRGMSGGTEASITLPFHTVPSAAVGRSVR